MISTIPPTDLPTAETLNQRFATLSSLGFDTTESGLTRLKVNNASASASLSLYGGQLLTYTPAGAAPILWLSDASHLCRGKPIRGGIPICWPWFGPHPQTMEDNHGFAKWLDWHLEDATESEQETRLTLVAEGEQLHPLWPYRFRLVQRLIIGAELQLTLTTHNLDQETFWFTQALHTYYQVSDIESVQVIGLGDVPFYDKLADYQSKTHPEPLIFTGAMDSVYCGHTTTVTLQDPKWHRWINVHKQGSQSTVVWNPWQSWSQQFGDFTKDGYKQMLCIETANALDNQVILAPGESHALTLRISSQPE